MSDEKIEKITQVSRGIEETTNKKQTIVPDKEHFDVLMQQNPDPSKIKVNETAADQMAKKSTLMDEVSKANNTATYPQFSPSSLVAQAQEVVTKIDSIKQDLQTPNLQIKDSVQNLLKNKLEHIDENLKIALEKVGRTEEYTPPAEMVQLGKPIERFLGLLTHSQHHLNTIADDVKKMHENSANLSPAAMLSLQIKVAFVQQELEFFTSLLNKALESTKTIMNVQV